MTLPELITLAEEAVKVTQHNLPADLQVIAYKLPVIYHDFPTDEILGDEFEPDILGMFAGPPYGSDLTESNEVPAQVMLFVENIWDFSDGNVDTYRDEVRLTYLHELGHYLGWDEEDVAARGLE